jgi:hypothetical protein
MQWHVHNQDVNERIMNYLLVTGARLDVNQSKGRILLLSEGLAEGN